jgi:hypothetical protein
VYSQETEKVAKVQRAVEVRQRERENEIFSSELVSYCKLLRTLSSGMLHIAISQRYKDRYFRVKGRRSRFHRNVGACLQKHAASRPTTA